MSAKIQFAIYQIQANFTSAVPNRPTVVENINFEFLESKIRAKGFKKQALIVDSFGNFDLLLFYRKSSSEVSWKEFITTIAKEDSKILKSRLGQNESFVLFLKVQSTAQIFAVTGGFGHTAIQDFTNQEFGLEIISRLVRSDERVLRAAKEKSIVGSILGSVKFFRNEYNLFENENFGNIYQELQANLSKQILIDTFGFTAAEVPKSGLCIAKSSFMIKKSLDLPTLTRIIDRCIQLLSSSNAPIVINSVSKIDKRQRSLLTALEARLFDAVWKTLLPNFNSDIEICHKEFDRYLTANEFYLSTKVGGQTKQSTFQEPLQNMSMTIGHFTSLRAGLTKNQFERFFDQTIVESIDENGSVLTTGKLRDHLFTEITDNSHSYFFIDREWFEIKDTFVERLNAHCKSFVKDHQYGRQLERWGATISSEGKYNLSHLGKDKTLVFDTVTPENIEACDILQWDAEKIYFVHVKEGFKNTTRDLTNQILIAAKRLREDKLAGGVYFRKLYQTVSTSSGLTALKPQLSALSEDDFVQLFNERRLAFVLAILDTSASGVRRLVDMEQFDSNIAKFSLHSLIQEMRGLDIELQIQQILRS